MRTRDLRNRIDLLLHCIFPACFAFTLKADALLDRFADRIFACALTDLSQIRPTELVRMVRNRIDGNIFRDGRLA